MRHIKLLIYLAVILVITGCVAPKQVPLRNMIWTSIELVDSFENPLQGGVSYCHEGVCTIQILKSEYPRCITHEVMHGFQGPWHEGRETLDFCNIKE